MLKTKLAYIALGAMLASIFFAGCFGTKQPTSENKEGGYYQNLLETSRLNRYKALTELGQEHEKTDPLPR